MRIGLVLGSGGARGYAHIGVIEALTERGHEIVAISGASMGALIGGLTAVDKLADFKSWVETLSQRDIWRLLDPTLLAPGAIRLERVFGQIAELFGSVNIEDLPISFTAVATDLYAQREIWFQSGPLVAAVRASIAIPSVITPVVINGRVLVDGGVVNPVPMGPVLGAEVDRIVAVDLAAGLPQRPSRASSERDESAWQRELLNNPVIKAILDRLPQGAAEESVFEELPKDLGATDVARLSLDTMQALITRYHLATFPPDVLIEVPQDSLSSLDFHRATEQIGLGRRLADEAFAATDL